MIRALLVSMGGKSIANSWRCGLALTLIGFLSACGGGGGGGSSSASTAGGGSTNASPVVGIATPSNVSVVTAQNAGN